MGGGDGGQPSDSRESSEYLSDSIENSRDSRESIERVEGGATK